MAHSAGRQTWTPDAPASNGGIAVAHGIVFDRHLGLDLRQHAADRLTAGGDAVE